MDQLLSQLGGAGGLSGLGGPKVLVSVKAGKMSYDGRIVKPERRKGIIRVTQDS